MDWNVSAEAITLALVGGFSTGFGLISATHLIRQAKQLSFVNQAATSSATAVLEDIRKGAAKEGRPPRRKRKRVTSCLSLSGNSIRHTDGSYTTGYTADSPSTLLTTDNAVDELYDRHARLLVQEKPAGTVVQMRWANHCTAGKDLLEPLETAVASGKETYAPARDLAADALRFKRQRLETEGFRSGRLSVWARVPVKLGQDAMNNGLSMFLRTFSEAVRPAGVKAAWTRASRLSGDGITRRFQTDEARAKRAAEKVFAQIEQFSAVKLERLSGAKLWNALYLSHNESAKRVPVLPDREADEKGFYDLRFLLGSDSIRAGSNYLLHGDTPVQMVSLSLPPAPNTENGVLRLLTQNPLLRFRYTLIVEYINYGKKKSLNKLDWLIFWNKRSQNLFKSPEAERAGKDLEKLRYDLAGPNAALIGTRVYTVVYGKSAVTQADLETSVKQLTQDTEDLITHFKQLPGADAVREETDVMSILYPQTLIGEMTPKATGFEVDEEARAAATFAPLESAWPGLPRPHTILENASGELFGINLFQSAQNTSALGIVLGQTRSGKSVLIGKMITDILATKPGASVVAMDFGETFGPLCAVLEGRQIRFVPTDNLEDIKTINIWDYEGLESGLPPTEAQIALVTGDLLNLAGVNEMGEDGKLKGRIIESVVKEVYRNFVPLNSPEMSQLGERREPLHSDFLNMLENFPFEGVVKSEADKLFVLLGVYRDSPWLDAPTHVDFHFTSRFDVYELDSLEHFSPDVKESLAYRVAARIITSAGKKTADGKFLPKVQVFEEMHKVKDNYPQILKAIVRGARQGGKENLVTLLATHAYEDLSDLHGLTKNAGIKIVGKQIGNFELLAKDADFTPATVAAIKNISNIVGGYSQFLFSFGSGPDARAELANVVLSAPELWTHTSNPIERNARTKTAFYLAHLRLYASVLWLAANYPSGLVAVNLEDIASEHERQLAEIRQQADRDQEAMLQLEANRAAINWSGRDGEVHQDLNGDAMCLETPAEIQDEWQNLWFDWQFLNDQTSKLLESQACSSVGKLDSEAAVALKAKLSEIGELLTTRAIAAEGGGDGTTEYEAESSENDLLELYLPAEEIPTGEARPHHEVAEQEASHPAASNDLWLP